MNKWKIVLVRQADKQLQKLPEAIQDMVFESLEDLESEGAVPQFWDVKKIGENEYRLRINYRYRMRYRVEETRLIIEIFYIGHRKDAYK